MRLNEVATKSDIYQYHGPRTDVLVDASVVFRDSFIERFREGLPRDWVAFFPYRRRVNMNLFVDSLPNPSLIAKTRPPLPILPSHVDGNRYFRIWNSLSNELSLSRSVSSIVDSCDAQQVAKRAGYEDIQFVAPIGGVIEREARRKFLVYPMITDASYLSPDYKADPLLVHFNQVKYGIVDGLRPLFKAGGIIPRDMDENQFLMTEDGQGEHLYLIDIECFERRR